MPELNFKGKEFVRNHHLSVPQRPLQPDAELSVGEPRFDGNLIIHGDNLHALKALLPLYANRVNCIYIDPPYNTGNEGWCYNDNVNSPHLQAWLNQNPVGVDDGLRHDKWCCMMWPRLKLLHELLAEDGVIFISIDDNEQHHLRMMMDEIFGGENFVATLVRKTKIGGGSDSRHFVKEHDYIISYAQKTELLNPMFVQFSEKYLTRYKESDSIGKFFWDTFARPGLKQPLTYTIVAPDGQQITGDWVRSKTRFEQDIKNGEIKFEEKKTGGWSVLFKQRLNHKGRKPRTLSAELGGTIEGKNEIREIFGDDRIFQYPKSHYMIKFLLQSINNPNAIILDSFAGSGTTAHAVLALNKQDGGNRKFILVECEEYADRITAERVRRVIKGVPTAKDENLQHGLGGDFTYCALGSALEMDRLLSGKDLPNFRAFGALLFHIATNEVIDTERIDESAGYLGASTQYHLWLIYKPDVSFLQSDDSALTLSKAREYAAAYDDKPHLVFAPARFVSDEILRTENIPVIYQPLPWALYRIGEQ